MARSSGESVDAISEANPHALVEVLTFLADNMPEILGRSDPATAGRILTAGRRLGEISEVYFDEWRSQELFGPDGSVFQEFADAVHADKLANQE